MAEYFEIYNENGDPAGRTASRKEAHRNGYWHRTAHIWILSEGNILLQLRSFEKDTFPNRWDISAAGHLDIGETPLQAARRELKEELGIDAAELKINLEFIGEIKNEVASKILNDKTIRSVQDSGYFNFEQNKKSQESANGNAFIDREIQSVFIAQIPHIPEYKFQIQKSEVQKVKWFSVKEFFAELKKCPDCFVPHEEEIRLLGLERFAID